MSIEPVDPPSLSFSLVVLLNKLVLAASAKGYQQDREGIPADERITDTELERIEQQIVSLFVSSLKNRLQPLIEEFLGNLNVDWCQDGAHYFIRQGELEMSMREWVSTLTKVLSS